MFIAMLFTMSRKWKQSKCPLIDEWIVEMWFISTTEYYSGEKKNEIMSFASKWMEFKKRSH